MAKRQLILIHGFRGTHHGLSLIAQQLPEYQCLIPDLPGFGDGPDSPRYDLDAYVNWLHGYVMAHRGPKKPILLGHSFGSIICSAYAARFPKTIDKLILVNPIGAPALEGPRALLSRVAMLYYWVGKQLPDKLGKAWLSSWVSVQVMSSVMTKTKNRQLRRFIHAQHHRYFSRFHSTKSVYEAFLTSIRHDVGQVATRITIPVLLIAGDQDDITPVEKQYELQQLFPNAQLVVIERVGHLTHYETPERVATAIESFIKEV